MSDPTLTELGRDECLALLGTSIVGQLALTRRGLPTVVPARFVLEGECVLIHVTTGLDPVPWIDGQVVTLQVCEFDDDQRSGWSVSVTGAAHGTPDLRRRGTSPTHRGSPAVEAISSRSARMSSSVNNSARGTNLPRKRTRDRHHLGELPYASGSRRRRSRGAVDDWAASGSDHGTAGDGQQW